MTTSIRTRPAAADFIEPSAAITVGSAVRYLGFAATVARIAEDRVDLIFYEDGKPRVALDVVHGHEPGEWLTPDEFGAGRPKTPYEMVKINREGGLKAPSVGLRVIFREAIGRMGWVHTIPTRAVILDYQDMETVSLAVLTPEPPDDPTAPDLPTKTLRGVRHWSTAEEKTERQGFPGCWSYKDELTEEFGEILKDEIFPPFKCDHCLKGMAKKKVVYLDKPDDSRWLDEVPQRTLCLACWAQVEAILSPAPRLMIAH
jgi:hypothetical protein